MESAGIRMQLETIQEGLELTRAEVVELEGLALRCHQGHGVFRSAPLPGAFALDLHDDARLLLSWVRFRGGEAVSAHDALEAHLRDPAIGLDELREGLGAARELVELLEAHDELRARAEEAYTRVDGALGAKARRAHREASPDEIRCWPPGTPQEVASLAPRMDEKAIWALLRSARGRLLRGWRMARAVWRGGLRLVLASMVWSGVVVMLVLAGTYEDALGVREIEARYFARLTSDSINRNTVAIGDLHRQLDERADAIAREVEGAQARSYCAMNQGAILKELSELRGRAGRESSSPVF